MGCEGLAALGEEEHRTLLQYLCDEILDRDGLRDHLQNRMDAADGNKKDRHGNRWEEIGNFPVRMLMMDVVCQHMCACVWVCVGGV